MPTVAMDERLENCEWKKLFFVNMWQTQNTLNEG